MKAMSKKCFRIAVCCALALGVCLVFAAGPVQADPVMVQNDPGQLSIFNLPTSGGTAGVTLVGSAATFPYNNLGYSSTIDWGGGTGGDGSLFALHSTTGLTNQQLGLIQINPATGANTNLGLTTNLPTGSGSGFQAGDAFENTLWVTFGAPATTVLTAHSRKLWTVNLSTNTTSITPTTITGMGANTAVADWAYVPGADGGAGGSFDGLLFGGDREFGRLWSLDPDDGTASVFGTFDVANGSGAEDLFGAAWYDPTYTDGETTGGIFLYRNNPAGGTNGGRIYWISTAGALLQTWNAPGVVVNDGAFVAQGPIVPIPGAALLLGSGLIGLAFVRRRFKS